MSTMFGTAATALALLGCALTTANAQAQGKDPSTLRRGAMLVGIGGCADCHTPMKMGANGPERDAARGLSGHPEAVTLPTPPQLAGPWNWAGAATLTAFSGPWGVTYASNLTPDRETGIGGWSARDFVQAMRTGRHAGVGRPIMPPMPWQSLAALSDRDLNAIFAYLSSRPAVKNRVPEHQPPGTLAAK